MYVCICKGVTDKQLRDAVADGALTVGDLRRELGVSTQCGRCACSVKEVLEEGLQTVDGGELYHQLA